MKNKYTFGKYLKEHLPIIAIFLIGLILSGIAAFLIIYITVKIKYGGYILIFSLLAFAIINAIYDNYQDCKAKYYQEQKHKHK